MNQHHAAGFLLMEVLAATIVAAVLTVALIATLSPRPMDKNRMATAIPIH